MNNREIRHLTFYEYAGAYCGERFVDSPEMLGLEKKHLDEIAKLNARLGGLGAFDIRHNRIRARSYVGVFRIGDFQIEILPKLMSPNAAHDTSTILENLFEMLLLTSKLPVHIASELKMAVKAGRFFDAYIALFARATKELVARRPVGFYEFKTEDLPLVKGRINFSKSAQLAARCIPALNCTYDEFSYNNRYLQAVRCAVKCVRKLVRNFDIERDLKTVDALLSNVTERPVSYHEIRDLSWPARDKLGEQVWSWVKMILRNYSFSSANQSGIESFSLLFDMNALFEEFVFELLARNKSQLGIRSVRPQVHKRLVSRAIDLVSSQSRGENLVETKADIVIEFLDGSKIVLDTKYKVLLEEERDLGVANADLYQMMAYHRIHTAEAPPKLVLLYPKNSSTHRVRLDIRGGDVAVGIFTLNLHRPLNKERGAVVSELGEIFAQAKAA